MTLWPIIKTAKNLVAEGIVPWPERRLVEMAKKYGVGRKEGRTYIFTPSEIAALLERLPCPSPSNDDTAPRTGMSADRQGHQH